MAAIYQTSSGSAFMSVINRVGEWHGVAESAHAVVSLAGMIGGRQLQRPAVWFGSGRLGSSGFGGSRLGGSRFSRSRLGGSRLSRSRLSRSRSCGFSTITTSR